MKHLPFGFNPDLLLFGLEKNRMGLKGNRLFTVGSTLEQCSAKKYAEFKTIISFTKQLGKSSRKRGRK